MDVASSERLRTHLRLRRFGRGLAARVLVPPHDITGARPPNHARIPTLAPFRPQAFAASRRFSPRSGFEACFILEPCTGTRRRSGGSRSKRPSSLVERRCPLAVGVPDAPPALRRRVRIRSASTSRLCSAWRSVHAVPVISRNGGRSPPRVRVSSRYSTPRHASRFTQHASARDVPTVGLRLRDLRRPAPPAYCPPRSRAVLSPDPPTCSRF